jgi:hypothetical protein
MGFLFHYGFLAVLFFFLELMLLFLPCTPGWLYAIQVESGL